MALLLHTDHIQMLVKWKLKCLRLNSGLLVNNIICLNYFKMMLALSQMLSIITSTTKVM